MITKIEFLVVVVIAVVAVPILGAPGNGYNVQERILGLIDSCSVFNDCDPLHGKCVQIDPQDSDSYRCQCDEGYEGDGYRCTEKGLTECYQDSDCDETSTCVQIGKEQFMCQRKEGYSVATRDDSRCDKGWTAVTDQKCVKLSEEKLTFEEAQKACGAISPFARLAEPRNAEENEVMKSLVGDDGSPWIGGADNTFGNGNEGEFVWLSDKSPILWADWYPGEPNNGGGRGQHCLSYLHRRWDDDDCDKKERFLCQKELSGCFQDSDCHEAATCVQHDKEQSMCQCLNGYSGDGRTCTRDDSRCDKGWTAVTDQKCVKLSEEKLTFEEAQKACRAMSPFARLAEPRSPEENEVMKSLVGDDGSPWIGGADNTFGNGNEGEFVWLSDKSPILWADWYPGEPNNGGGRGQHCLSYLHQRWDDDDCDKKERFLCQKDFECGKWPNKDGQSIKQLIRRIVKGDDAHRGQFPWQAGVGKPSGQGFWAYCGGTIIAPTWVLTAAHCVTRNGRTKNPDSVFISVGDHHMKDNHQHDEYHRVKAIHKNPEHYIGRTHHNDIALVELKDPIKFNNVTQPACLPKSGERPKSSHCYISGWGNLVEGGSQPDVLQGLEVKIESEADCTNYLTTDHQAKLYGYLPDRLLCVGHHEALGACHGDSGGPLACDEDGKIKVYGATHGGMACGNANHPSIYAAVSSYISWIDQTVNEN